MSEEESKEEEEIRKCLQDLLEKMTQQALQEYRMKRQMLMRETLEGLQAKIKGAAPEPYIGARITGKTPRVCWTGEEEETLLALLKTATTWEEVREHFPDKSWEQLYGKVHRLKVKGLFPEGSVLVNITFPKHGVGMTSEPIRRPTPEEERKLTSES